MAVAMPALRRNPGSGSWMARKVIPEDVREVFGKREAKRAWPATLSEAEAKAAYGEWLRDTESKIAAARQGRVSLSEKEVRTIAAKWYREERAKADGQGEHPETLKAVLTVLSEGKASPTVSGLMQKLAAERLQAEAINADAQSRDRLADEFLRLHISLNAHQLARAEGRYEPDPEEARLPATSKAPVRPRAASPTVSALFQKWTEHPEQRANAPSTISRYGSVFKAFAKFAGRKRASEIEWEEVARYLDELMHRDVAPRTVRDVHLASLNSVFGWAVSKRIVSANPAAGHKIKARRPVSARPKEFSDEEAQAILKAALATPASNSDPTRSAALRWVPFLMAYTGCRVQEATQLRKEDVRRHPDGFLYVRFTPDAGTIKTGKSRDVPLHARLEALGFWQFVQACVDGPMFYDVKKRRRQNAPTAQAESRAGDISEWVRKDVGVTDKRIWPNHAWRHRFKTAARNAGIDPQYIDAITGHANGSEGARYGSFPLAALHREVAKLSIEEIEGVSP